MLLRAVASTLGLLIASTAGRAPPACSQCSGQLPPGMSRSPICGTPFCPPDEGAMPAPLPRPVAMTHTQRDVVERARHAARLASEAAKPVVLEWLGSEDFLAELDGCCEHIHKMSRHERLEWIDAEFRVAELAHNFNDESGKCTAGPEGDESICLGYNASFFYNLWDIQLLTEQGSSASPPSPSPQNFTLNCSVVDDPRTRLCGNGVCKASSSHPFGFTCTCAPGYHSSTPSQFMFCDKKIPLKCEAQQSRLSCENSTGGSPPGWGQLPDCQWVTELQRCVKLAATQSQSRQNTDIAEVGLYGFPEFKNISGEGNGEQLTITREEAIQRPIYTAFASRKIDVGNPMFGPISAIFSPNFVRNMTIIAPIDTGAWESECNSTRGAPGHNPATDPTTCARHKTASSCNQARKDACDWRRTPLGAFGCVNTALDRMRCSDETTEAGCQSAPGLPAPQLPFSFMHQQIPLKKWWAHELYDGGCMWDSAKQTCHSFSCSRLQTEQVCHLAAHPPPPNNTQPPLPGQPPPPSPRHCVWNTQQAACVKMTESEFCEESIRPKPATPLPPGVPPPPPPPPPAVLCGQGESSLCSWIANSTIAEGGRCGPTHCTNLRNETECTQKNDGFAISCAWVPFQDALLPHVDTDEAILPHPSAEDGRCIVFGENCTRLPTRDACELVDSCLWHATGGTKDGRESCHPKGAGPGPGFGWTFNCSNTAWYGGSLGAPGLPGRGPGKLTLGTAEYYYHTLAGGVNVWTDSSPASQLGVLVRRMAEPYSTNISQQEIFKYWEAMIAGQPLFPEGIKMLVGSFPKLFGTADGRRLQAWCKKEGWVLMWALGEVGADPPGPSSPSGVSEGAPYANRSLDLQVLEHSSAAHNLSITNERRLEFDGLWLDVAQAINRSLTPHSLPGSNHTNGTNSTKPTPPPPGKNKVTNAQWRNFWSRMPSEALVGFLDQGSCADPSACVGVRISDGSCVCYQDRLQK